MGRTCGILVDPLREMIVQPLVTNYRDDGMMAGISKGQLDKGVEGSLYQDLEKLKESIVRQYPQLRKSKETLEFGYKLAYEGLSENQKKINLVTPQESRGWFDWIKERTNL